MPNHSSPSTAPLDESACLRLDADSDATAFETLRARLAVGEPGTIYLDANSIGPMPVDVPARMAHVLDQGWRLARRRGWNTEDWLDQPRRLGAAIAP